MNSHTMDNDFSVDVSAENFNQAVIEKSKEVPVLVDFWAPWCGPCQSLKPILEKLSEAYQGKFRLAKVNSDENQALSGKYGIRGIPNVKAFVNGEIVDEFSGALPEKSVREFIDRLLPSPGEELRKKALEQLQAGASSAALATLSEAALLDPRNDLIKTDQAQILLDAGHLDEAALILKQLSPLSLADERAAALMARLQFALKAQAVPDEATLKSRIAADPGDLEARLQLANLWAGSENYEPAMEALLEIIRRDRKFKDDIGRKTLLELFHLLGGRGELVTKYRRLMANALN